jgi:hypothetical protein
VTTVTPGIDVHTPKAGAMRRCPVQSSTPLGPEQVNVLFRSAHASRLDRSTLPHTHGGAIMKNVTAKTGIPGNRRAVALILPPFHMDRDHSLSRSSNIRTVKKYLYLAFLHRPFPPVDRHAHPGMWHGRAAQDSIATCPHHSHTKSNISLALI